jgi:ribonucleoside-diphosphate reductase alpha chain
MQELPTLYQQFIHQSRYARWLDYEGRRETWPETVRRYMMFMTKHLYKQHKYEMPEDLFHEVEAAILNLEVMPSMRCLMTAGPALERDNVAGYNCSYLPVDSPRAFDEALYILMCGVGVGFSVERQYVGKLPLVNEHFEKSDTTIVVEDSKAGWARALRELIAMLYAGQIPSWDTSKVRGAGERLKTFGGRSSGPEPLERLFRFCVEIFKGAKGRHLTSLECHDIMCMIGEIVVVGGVRRSAMISLSNLTDDRMRGAKSGQWWVDNKQRALANNSVSYTENPDMGAFMTEWKALYDSKSGERGIFNRVAAKKQSENGRRDPFQEWGTNPCSEIILRPNQFCNLSEAVIRSDDGVDDVQRKVRIASILGTWQSTLTNFKYLRKKWKQQTEEERLLGVSLTGIMDNEFFSGAMDERMERDDNGYTLSDALEELRDHVIATNKQYAEDIGIPQSTATTCVKPSGTVSQLVDAGSGLHDRHSPYYIRTVRGDKKDPLTQFLVDQGIPAEDCVFNPATTKVFSFPQSVPEGAVTRNDRSAVEQLETWVTYQRHWCEHKPSVTITVREHEWMDVGAWVWNHFNEVSGISFLPHSDHVYQQAPYQECDETEYERVKALLPKEIDWSLLQTYESEDNTESSQTLACTGGSCEVVDFGGNS